jgi:transposase-like protein
MTLLVGIGCPACRRKRSVRKRGLGRYYCEACDRELTQREEVSLPDPTEHVEDG